MAFKKGIPVLYSPVYEATGRDTMLDLLEEAGKIPKLIRYFQPDSMHFSPQRIKELLAENRIHPTEISLMGQLRDFCVKNAALAIRQAYPEAVVTVLEGKSTLLPHNSNHFKETYLRELAANNIKRTKKFRISIQGGKNWKVK